MARLPGCVLCVVLLAGCGVGPNDGATNVAANADNVVVANDIGNDIASPASDEGEDAKVAGTDYNAVADIPCGDDGVLASSCSAGVKRSSGSDATSFVEVTMPDGAKRVLFFQGRTPSGADSNQADGSADYRFLWHREGDWTVIKYGPERYRVPDALVVGG